MAVTHKGKSNRERFLAPEDKFKTKKTSLMIPIERLVLVEGIVVSGDVPVLEEQEGNEPPVVGPKPDELETIPEKPKKRGRPKKRSVKEEKEREML